MPGGWWCGGGVEWVRTGTYLSGMEPHRAMRGAVVGLGDGVCSWLPSCSEEVGGDEGSGSR